MPNLAICRKSNGVVLHFLRDAVKAESGDGVRCDYYGSGRSLKSVKLAQITEVWTDDLASPIIDSFGQILGYDKNASDLVPSVALPDMVEPSVRLPVHARKKLLSKFNAINPSRIDEIIDNALMDQDKMRTLLKFMLTQLIELVEEVRSRNGK